MQLQRWLLNRCERCCRTQDVAIQLQQPGQQRLGDSEATRGQYLDRGAWSSSPGEPGAVMESPKRGIIASGLLDRPFKRRIQVFHTGRSPQTALGSRRLR